MDGQQSTSSPHSRRASRARKSVSGKDAQRLEQEMLCDPWPVTKFVCRKDFVFEAAQVLVRARNTELINVCNNAIILLPASGSVPDVQGGSPDRPLYSLRPPSMKPFKVHLWQIPAVRTWNRITWSWDVTPGIIMVRRGHQSEPLTQLLMTLGVGKGEAKMSDLCNHFRCWRHLDTGGEWLNQFPRPLRGMVYQIWWSFNGFRFLQLPPELRELILTFAMGPIAVPLAWRWRPRRYPQLAMPNMSLSLVSKQLNREVTAALLAHTTFDFHTIEQFYEFFWRPDEWSRPAFRSLEGLRSLELDLSPDELFRLFGVFFGLNVCGARNSCYERSCTLDPGIFFNGKSPLCHHICIRIPHVFQLDPRPDHTCCQKLHNRAFWAGARARLRSIAVIEFGGHIDDTQKKRWLAEHALERKGAIPRPREFAEWQREIWFQCSEAVCDCSPECNTWRSPP